MLVRVVVDRLGGERAQRRFELRREAREHRRGHAARVVAQRGRTQHVPGERPVERRVLEVGERGVDVRDGAAEAGERPCVVLGQAGPRRPRHPRQDARHTVAGRHACGAVPGGAQARRRHVPRAAGDVRHRGVLEVEPSGVGPGGVQLEHVAVERVVAIELAGQGTRLGVEAEVLAGEGSDHVTRPGRGSTVSCSPRATRSRSRVDRLPHVGVAGVERRDAEPDGIRAAEVGDDAGAVDQRARDLPGLRVAQRDVGAARGGVARRAEREAERREPGVVQGDDQLGQRDRLAVQRGDAGLGGEARALLHGGEAEDRRRAGEEAADRRLRVVVALHRELLALAEPAPDRRAQHGLERGRRRRGRPGRPGRR